MKSRAVTIADFPMVGGIAVVRNSLTLVALSFVVCVNFVLADDQVTVVGPNGQPMVIPAGAMQMGGNPFGNGGPGQPGAQDPGKAGAEKKPEQAEGGAEPEQPEPKVIRREELDGGKADPAELRAKVGDDGKVAFQFRNQPWVGLVQWLSEISQQPVDWLELPADKVNLASPGRYTVAETKDLFNRHLLARGYTILELDGGMTIASTKAINPAMVPRVDLDELAGLPPHTFVRTSLDVGWLSAEGLTKELANMVSSNGKLTALATTNRIEAMDAAVNLRHIAELLAQERDASSVEALAPEFKLRYLGAMEAKRMLEEFLGIEKKKASPMTPQQMQMMMQMQQQNPGAGGAKKGSREVSIVANTRQNSVIIRAPVDRTAIAMEFLKRIDVPANSLLSLADVESRVQVFELQSLDPEKLIEILGEMNVLEPTSRIRPDKDNKAIIVSASAADRYIIQRLIERLDSGPRELKVLQLRRLEANEVAESIAFLMGQAKEDDSSSRRRWSWFDSYQEEEKDEDEFRVAANTRYRQVLLWANADEMKQVENLLVQLGEMPPPGGSSRTTRLIDASATPETFEYLQRLQRQWNQVSPSNQLLLPDQNQFQDPIEEFKRETTDEGSPVEGEQAEPKREPNAPANDVTGNAIHGVQLAAAQLPQLESESGEPVEKAIRSSADFDRAFRSRERGDTDGDRKQSVAPIRIEVDANGNLVLSSSDTKALDRLETMMLRMKPPRRPYRVFKIEYASAYWIRLNLEDYFDEEEKGDSSDDDFLRWIFDLDTSSDDDQPAGLGRGNKMKFVDDPDTNTIVVTGARTEQLRTISELIELWDVPEPVNKRKMRFTRLVDLKYGKADVIAETIKEAYRDLLSSNDKSFRGGRQGQEGGRSGNRDSVPRNREGNGSGLVDQRSGNEGGGSDFSFKGKLSLGIDPVGNTLLVSAEGESLLDLVCDMIDQLDSAAKSSGEMQVIQLPSDVGGSSIVKGLESFGAKVQIQSQASAATGPKNPQ